MKILSFSTIALAASLCISNAAAAEPPSSPLTGIWVLCQDPDGSPKDSLEFFAEGYGFNRRPNAPMSPFLYKEAPGQLLLMANSRGNLLNVYLGVAPDHGRLTLKSERTGNEAYYVRSGQEQSQGCTAK